MVEPRKGLTLEQVLALWDRTSRRYAKTRADVARMRWHRRIEEAARIWSVQGTI